MKLPRYSEYKDSGVSWIGEVPSHWSIRRLKEIAKFSGGGTPARDNPAFWNGDIPWISPKDMKSELIASSEESVTAAGLAGSASSLVPQGTLLMVVRSGILKHTIPIGINTIPVALNQDMKALHPNGVRADFILRWVQGLNDRLLLVWSKQGATVESIEHDYLANTLIPCPDDGEQRAIAAFLDRETAKIDALIAEQKRLLELLAEKRQAVISHAVTKGLNPDAPMKDSGVAWLGEVPAHWDVVPLKYLVSMRSGGTPSKDNLDYWDGDVPWASSRDLKTESIDDTVLHISRSALEAGAASLVPKGSILVVVRGMILARLFPVVEALVPLSINQDLKAVLAGDRIEQSYLAWLLRGSAAESLQRLDEAGHGTKALRMEAWTSMLLAVPPRREQIEVANFIKERTREIDGLSIEVEKGIALLSERRSALIAAAVTGQIDVREAA